ncbi:dihydrodipicolinate synthase family protein [Tuanshanicoccus lijuaniae]|uniref:dihydrodipicolinate synthase family protein n=1 Tax=Aerococcaceae bacterium zg-1292 TaxID=2774330 RepID=UPI0019374394|nr:dihydrodipicolinate synthase family protein [Aerococcaceae bacterium zg-1292]QQA37027.1 dihydrodipicolinate synthase family protein [Aerococcaceae bacterium zg-1292]
MEKNTSYGTVFPAISVPLNNDYTINEQEYRNYLEWLVSVEGIGGILTNGHTGEITSLTREERKRVTEITVDQVGDRVLVVSGVNSENTNEAIEYALDAKEVGADGIMLMPPHGWLRFGTKPESAFRFYKDVADATDLDMIIHLYPQRTKAFLPVDLLIKMCKEIPQIKAIKQGTRNSPVYEHDVRLMHKVIPHVKLLTCYDEAIASSIIPGMDGAVLGFAGVVPEIITGLFKTYYDRDFTGFMKYYEQVAPIMNAIYESGQPSGEAHARLKAALVERGAFSSPLMKLPIIPISEEEAANVKKGIEETGLPNVNLI